MKELLKFSKYLESDFVNPNPTYQSKMDLAISSLVTGDYQKAKNMFDAAIEIDSQFPSAWLGKAFSEIAYVEDEHFNSLTIDEYLSRAMRSTDNILKYKVAIAGCLAYRHAVIIKKCVLAVEEALRQKKEAEKAKSRGIATAIVGSMFTGKDKSIGSNIVGGALIAGGTTYAMQSHLKAKELELSNATFINNYQERQNKTKAKSIKAYLTDFSEQIDLETIRINNGFVKNKSINNNKEIIVGGIQSEISVNEIFDLSTYEGMVTSIEKMNFDSAKINLGKQNIELYQGKFLGSEKSIKAKLFILSSTQNRISADNVSIQNYRFNDDFTKIKIDSILYSNANIQIKQSKTKGIKSINSEEDEI